MYAVRDIPNGEGLELDGTAEENLEEPPEQNSPTRSALLQQLQLRPCVTPDTRSSWDPLERAKFRQVGTSRSVSTVQDRGGHQNTMQ